MLIKTNATRVTIKLPSGFFSPLLASSRGKVLELVTMLFRTSEQKYSWTEQRNLGSAGRKGGNRAWESLPWLRHHISRLCSAGLEMPNKKHLHKHALVRWHLLQSDLNLFIYLFYYYYYYLVYSVTINKLGMRGNGRDKVSSLAAWGKRKTQNSWGAPEQGSQNWTLPGSGTSNQDQRNLYRIVCFFYYPHTHNIHLLFIFSCQTQKHSIYLPNVDLFLLTSQQWYPKREDRLTENIAAAKNKNMMWNLAWVSGRPFYK